MKKSAVAAFVLQTGLLASSLYAQPTEARFTVPFDFSVSGRTLPAGTYRLYTQSGSILVIQNINRAAGALSIISLSAAHSRQHAIVFHKYGSHYFLREINSSIETVDGELPLTKAEKQAQMLEASLPAEQVAVAQAN